MPRRGPRPACGQHLHMPTPNDRLRLDKWLWAARFFKTRALAVEAVERHRVTVNGAPAKPGREVHIGDNLRMTLPGAPPREVTVVALSSVRGQATVAQVLYRETAESLAGRVAWAERRRTAPEPGAARTEGRPTKRERRDLDATSERWRRWSATIDDR
jgi:ribosome-associated heat shock protein Hsp15